MDKLKIKTQSKVKRCEICHQVDMFEQEKELCLRCLEINTDILKSKSDTNKDKLYLIPSKLNTTYLSIIALIFTLIAHIPLMFLITISPPFYSSIVFFLVETFIISFAVRWKKEIRRGVFIAVSFSIIFSVVLFYANPYRVLVSCFCGKH